jgi:hypothetical protein
VLYFGTTLEVCFGETLARYRPDVELLAEIQEEWRERGFMPPGEVPADWRQRRLAVRVRFPESLRFPAGIKFVDVESAETREVLRKEMADILAYLGYDDLDVATVRGQDRRVTRWISRWAFDQHDEVGNPIYAGVRYLSRLDSAWECWATFDDVELEEVSRHSILPTDDNLRRVAKRYGLRIF